MFSRKITETDQFLDLPMSTQCLYFHLNMSADDDGFVSNAKTIRRMIGASDDDLKLLMGKEFIIPFESGVVVIKDWKIHNYIRSDRYNETVYKEEKKLLEINENGQYKLDIADNIPNDIPSVIPTVYQRDTQVRLGKVRLGKDSNNNHQKKKNNSSKQALISERFEKIWKLYPKKQGKTDAMNHYKKAIKEGITDEVILAGLQSYLQHIERNRIETKYIKQGSTWFSKKSWNDEYNFTKIKQANGIYQQTFSKENDPVITEEEARQAEEDLEDMV